MTVYCNGTGRRNCPCRYCAPYKPAWRERLESAVVMALVYLAVVPVGIVYHGCAWLHEAGAKRGWWS
jgi:hypothetical protein